MISWHLYQHVQFTIRCANQPWTPERQDAAFVPRISGVSSHPDVNTTAITLPYYLSLQVQALVEKNWLNNHVSHVVTGFLLVFLPHVGSFGTPLFPWHPMPFSIFQPPLPA